MFPNLDYLRVVLHLHDKEKCFHSLHLFNYINVSGVMIFQEVISIFAEQQCRSHVHLVTILSRIDKN